MGTVFLSQEAQPQGGTRWSGYWDSQEAGKDQAGPSTVLEELPDGTDQVTALQWARTRTPRIVVICEHGRPFWAGAMPPPSDLRDLWADHDQ
jgi:cytidine deaminase